MHRSPCLKSPNGTENDWAKRSFEAKQPKTMRKTSNSDWLQSCRCPSKASNLITFVIGWTAIRYLPPFAVEVWMRSISSLDLISSSAMVYIRNATLAAMAAPATNEASMWDCEITHWILSWYSVKKPVDITQPNGGKAFLCFKLKEAHWQLSHYPL